MKKVVFPVLIFVAAAVCAVAQDYRQKISANPAWAACEMCYYEPSESESTPAPTVGNVPTSSVAAGSQF